MRTNFSISEASGLALANFADVPRTRPPISAMHVEIPAVRPTIKTTGSDE